MTKLKEFTIMPDHRKATPEDYVRWHSMIGKKVWKKSGVAGDGAPKPFKSGLKVNTVTGVVLHPYCEETYAFTFKEDSSVVECWRCSIAPSHNNPERTP